MEFVQQWNTPYGIWLLLPVMIAMIGSNFKIIWTLLRSHEITQTLLPENHWHDYHFIFVRTKIFSILGTILVLLLLVFFPSTVPLWHFLVVFLSIYAINFMITAYAEQIIPHRHFYHPGIIKNLQLACVKPFYEKLIPSHTLYHRSFFLLIFGLLTLALMNPLGEKNTTPLQKMPLYITVALDLSQSMQTQDVQPSRFELARDEILSLLSMNHGDEIGLVLFTNDAIIMTPQTPDLSTIKNILLHTKLSQMPSHGTNIHNALALAATTFDNVPAQPEKTEQISRRILLVTDGEDHGESLPKNIDYWQNQNIHIDVIAVGTANGAEVPDENGQQIQYNGTKVISQLHPEMLSHLAKQTDGLFSHLTTPTLSAKEITDYWNALRIDAAYQDSSSIPYRNHLYPRFLYPAFALIMLFLLIPLVFFASATIKTAIFNKPRHAPEDFK